MFFTSEITSDERSMHNNGVTIIATIIFTLESDQELLDYHLVKFNQVN